jgi:oxygen-dependent protoporphyrinogen oxidase
MAKVVIVGAGISGLSLAYRLTRLLPSADITILEERSRPGGTMWTERSGGFQVEIGPNGFLDTKPSTRVLCRDLGLEDRLVAASEASSKNRYLFIGGKLHALPHGIFSFLRSDLLSWRGKAAMLAEPIRRRKRGSEEESVDAFARRRFGREAAEVMVDAIVTGIHAGDPHVLSAQAAFPRLVEFEKEKGSVLRGFVHAVKQRRIERAAEPSQHSRSSSMWSFRDGLRLMVETLASALPTPPVLGVRVRRVTSDPERGIGSLSWTIAGEGRDRWNADAVVFTCPTYRQAEILADVDGVLAESIAGIPYNRIAVVALGYRQADVPQALDGFGFIAPQRTRGDLLGVQWCSSIFPDRSPPGTVLLRAMCGGWSRPEIVDWDDDRLLNAVYAELRAAMNIQAAPIFHSIIRWDKAIPQYTLGHLDRVARIQERAGKYGGLFLAGNGYYGVALNECTEQAEILAQKVCRFISDGTGRDC